MNSAAPTPSPAPGQNPKSSVLNRTRRFVLTWTGAGLLTAVAGYLGWRAAQRGDLALPKPDDGLKRVNSNGEPLPDPEPVTEPPISTPNRNAFAEHLGSEFEIDLAGISRRFKLVDVSPVQMLHGKGIAYSAWSVTFEHATPLKFDGRICRVTHEAMGTMEIFLSQVGRSDKRSSLEAVFSERV